MIIFFGPAGAGKSVQGQILAARFGWRWLSAGQLLRDTKDPELLEEMRSGGLAGVEKVNDIMGEALRRAKEIDKVILDGFPRQLEQAEWLIAQLPEHNRDIDLVAVLEVPRSEIEKRLKELLIKKSEELGVKIESIETMPEHVHLFIKAQPVDSPHFIVQQLKGYTSRIMRQEFKSLVTRIPSLWTRSYYVESVGHISEETIKKYIAEQKA